MTKRWRAVNFLSGHDRVQDLGLGDPDPILVLFKFKNVPVDDGEVGLLPDLQRPGLVLLPHHEGAVDGVHLKDRLEQSKSGAIAFKAIEHLAISEYF